MKLSSGDRLGPYEIVAPLGAGGMGEVYRARDPRLDRDVAIKVLPADVAGDRQRLGRFEQEARAASALNHPNILTVHDFGADGDVAYLVTELLLGESLREQVRRGPLPPKRVLELATQIARGLGAAHDRGIVHRDLKPENLFLTRDGATKILDFGLARIERAEASGGDLQDVSTVLETTAGTVLGTVGYMAPEQVLGQPADSRSDLFSLGVVLYEMLAGSNPFRRDSAIESLNAILKDPVPDLASASTGSNPSLERIVGRLLEKNLDRRFRSAHDLSFALEGLSDAPSGGQRSITEPLAVARRARRGWALPVGMAVALAVGFGLGLWISRGSSAPLPGPVQFEIPPPEGGWRQNAEGHDMALAPDGRTLAYLAESQGSSLIHLRDLDNIEPRTLAGTEGARSLFWSPDGTSLAFFSGGKLRRVARAGGPVQVVCETAGTNTGTWGSQGTIVFSQGFGPNDGLFRVPAAGGTPTRIPSAGDLPRWVEFLPDGRRFLYWDRLPDSATGKLYIGDLETERSSELLDVSSQARYAAPGWILYDHSNTLVAQRFDPRTAQISGEPVPLASNLPYFFNGWAVFTVAGANALAYQVNPAPPALAWFDRHGRELGRVGPPGRYTAVRLAPDGRNAVAVLSDPATAFTDLWIIDLERGGATRLTDEPFLEWSPVWSPDGTRIAYTATSPGPTFTLHVRRVVDGARVAALPGHSSFIWARGWSRDGLFLDRTEPETGVDLWRWPALDGDAVPILQNDLNEELASPSPDGRWLAFFSRTAGRGEIELLRPETPGRRIRVSTGAQAVIPRWRGDGRELFYVSAEGWLSAIAISGTDDPTFGEPQALFPVAFINEASFDVSADGQRFLVATTIPASSLPVIVELGWQAALPKR